MWGTANEKAISVSVRKALTPVRLPDTKPIALSTPRRYLFQHQAEWAWNEPMQCPLGCDQNTFYSEFNEVKDASRHWIRLVISLSLHPAGFEVHATVPCDLHKSFRYIVLYVDCGECPGMSSWRFIGHGSSYLPGRFRALNVSSLSPVISYSLTWNLSKL